MTCFNSRVRATNLAENYEKKIKEKRKYAANQIALVNDL
jgi:hypothetical protein